MNGFYETVYILSNIYTVNRLGIPEYDVISIGLNYDGIHDFAPYEKLGVKRSDTDFSNLASERRMFGFDWVYNFNNLKDCDLLFEADDIWDEYKPKDQIFEIRKLVDKSKNNPKYSELFYEIRHKTYSTAWEVYKTQLSQDIFDQVFMSVTAALLSAAVEAIITSATVIATLGIGTPAAIALGKAAGAATYLAVYTLMTKFNIDRKIHEAQSKERSETFYPASIGVQEPVSLNEKSFFDRILQDSMAAALIGHPGGYYATVSGEDSGTTYIGQLLVSPPNNARMFNMFGGFLELLSENFWNAGESDPDSFTALDFDEQNLDFLLMTSELPYYNTKDYYTYKNTEFLFNIYNQYSFNTLGALETQAREQTGGLFDAIRPTCIDGAPHYEFINSTHYETVLPQSILYRPVVLSEARYANLDPALGSLIVSVKCKDYGKTKGINAYQMNDVETEFYQAKVPLNDNGFEYPIQEVYIDVVQEEVFQNTYFAQNILVNESDYDVEDGNLYFTKSIEALISEKYPLFEDFLVQSWANEMIDHTIYYNIKILFDRFVPDTTEETRRLALA